MFILDEGLNGLHTESGGELAEDAEWDEDLFRRIRRGIIGLDQTIETPYGTKKILYADWCASGRLYAPVERFMAETVGPYAANTHTESNATGSSMTRAYKAALQIIRRHVNAGPCDSILTFGTGMTGAVNKLQRLMGLRIHERFRHRLHLDPKERPVLFITHMEHHSNHTSWLETICDVVMVPPDSSGLVCPDRLERMLVAFRHRPRKIGAFTACSNVTGIETPIHELARTMHRHGGLCFVDYSASAPYVPIDMHPGDPAARLDAVMFSPHKFLGGPGTSGVLVFNSGLVPSPVPDQPGGGTVYWTDPWGGRYYLPNLEEREDGGTPGFLQAIRTALCIKIKERMGTESMGLKQKALLSRLWKHLDDHPRIRVLEGGHRNRKAIVSMVFQGLHFNLVTRLLNDRYGIQARGGCSCAGSYGHYLFGIGPVESLVLNKQAAGGNPESKPGWVRLSLHPTMTLEEADAIGRALSEIAVWGDQWGRDYVWDPQRGDFRHIGGNPPATGEDWFQSEDFLFE